MAWPVRICCLVTWVTTCSMAALETTCWSGGDGNDWLSGGGGSDVMIGGDGADTLAKNTGSALQIAGSTSHDLDVAALQAILAEWANAKHTLAAKHASLQGLRADRRNGNYFLINSGSQATVFSG